MATLPITYCKDENGFKLFIDMMFKLIYESSKGKDATYPIWDQKAKYGKESYGKIRLVIHQLRNYYFHDFENWEKPAQDKLLIHVHEFFQLTIGKDEPDDDNEWINIQLAVLFKTTEYLTEAEFDEIMDLPLKSIHDYPNNHFLENGIRSLLHKLRYLKILPN